MSNKLEILEQYKEATSKLKSLKAKESEKIETNSSTETVVIQPQFGNEMNKLNHECEALNMILEAMDASED